MPNLSYGTYLQIAGVNNVASLTDIQGLDVKTNTVDVTNLGSAALFKEFMAGFKEVSDLTLTGFFRPDDSNGQMQLWSLLNSGAVTAFSIVFPFGASWNFNGIVTGFKTDAKTEDVTPFDGTIKITGAPTLNVTAILRSFCLKHHSWKYYSGVCHWHIGIHGNRDTCQRHSDTDRNRYNHGQWSGCHIRRGITGNCHCKRRGHTYHHHGN